MHEFCDDYQMITLPNKLRPHAWVGGCLLGVVNLGAFDSPRPAVLGVPVYVHL